MADTFRDWEYARRGDYHRELDPRWSYTPTYLRKMALVRSTVQELGPELRVLDAGCGEGVLVEELRERGYRAEGLDLNYESDLVTRGSILDAPYPDGSFDVALLLDVFEHIGFEDQPRVLEEIRRLLVPDGWLVASIPNLAHWNSRFWFALFGSLDRTDVDVNHVGERPYAENRALLENSGFRVVRVKGVTLTVPFLYRGLICRRPDRFRWLHDLLEPFAFPSLAMIDLFLCQSHGPQESGVEPE